MKATEVQRHGVFNTLSSSASWHRPATLHATQSLRGNTKTTNRLRASVSPRPTSISNRGPHDMDSGLQISDGRHDPRCQGVIGEIGIQEQRRPSTRLTAMPLRTVCGMWRELFSQSSVEMTNGKNSEPTTV